MPTFIPLTDATRTTILAGLADGTITAWRMSPNGTMWYRRLPIILGVPPDEVDDE